VRTRPANTPRIIVTWQKKKEKKTAFGQREWGLGPATPPELFPPDRNSYSYSFLLFGSLASPHEDLGLGWVVVSWTKRCQSCLFFLIIWNIFRSKQTWAVWNIILVLC
jgi:hypothetical protein